MSAAFDWDSPTFGLPGFNVHESADGSWVGAEVGEVQ